MFFDNSKCFGQSLAFAATICFWLTLLTNHQVHGNIGVKPSAANLTASNVPYPYYDYERDPRQWFSQGYGSYGTTFAPFNGGIETLVVGFMISLAIGFIGLPLMILLYSMFLGNTGSGFSLVPPSAATTTINGRKRREANVIEALLPQLDSVNNEKLIDIFKKLTAQPDQMNYLMKFFKNNKEQQK
ncbi:uncharacterized protein LOC128391183 [Panonychus citri]|uniref:uncharacterized protein LOC128391183 n=1 Tax=Panonychus citri TaxID=50023 RepID=UPI002307EA34|nr:uncharacterized protein LOC128391183 [Panonychus citri]